MIFLLTCLDPAATLAGCAGCAYHVEQVRAAVRLSQALPVEAAPADLAARLSALHRQPG